MANNKNVAQLEQEPQQIIPTVLVDKAMGEIATAALLRYGYDIQDVSDTRGPISGDMPVEDVYRQANISKPSLEEDRMSDLDKSAATIVNLSQDRDDPEEQEIAEVLIEDEVKKMEDSLLATKATYDAIKMARNPQEAKATQAVKLPPGVASGVSIPAEVGTRIRGSQLPAIDDIGMARILRKAGFTFVRQKGSHATYRSDDGHQAVVPVGHGDIATGTRDSIFNQAGIDDPRIYF